MQDAHECRKRAEALATLAEMFPEYADRYRDKERHWRDQETEAIKYNRLAGDRGDHGDKPRRRSEP